MLWSFKAFAALVVLGVLSHALVYTPDQVGFNLNENQTATDPLDYWGEWPDHVYHTSPSNWGMPMYSLFLDRFVNGDPSNDNSNGTQFEHDLLSNQLRNGGDVRGLQDTLDYIQGMGVKILYIAGSPMVNMPWGSDSYSPLDLTLLDRHHGNIAAWRDAISEIHQRGMYVVLDNTFATLGDLIGFENYLNQSTPFFAKEHNVIWKSDRRYHDFMQSDEELDKCEYPRFWNDAGELVTNNTFLQGCRNSEFDQYGEVASFGNYPEWQRQLSKFAFVQDRLREWRPSVLAKIQHFSCLTIASLDIDGFRIDKALQVTVDAQGAWSDYIRKCASRFNKTNFYIPGEIVAAYVNVQGILSAQSTEEYTLEKGPVTLGLGGYTEPNGCLSKLSMQAWGFKALVPKEKFVRPRPALTAFSPGHDFRLWSAIDDGDTVRIKFGFSEEMDCDSISNKIRISSSVSNGSTPMLDLNSVSCSTTNSGRRWVGEPTTTFIYQVDLLNVHHGVHQITVNNASSTDGSFTGSVDSVLLRVGDFDNPMVYPRTANYSSSLLFNDTHGGLYVTHHAAGADLWRYSLNFETTYSDWMPYAGGNNTLHPKVWSGTSQQAWKGEHVILQYWGQLAGSSDHFQHGDLNWTTARRFPNLWIEGNFNQHGYDQGLPNQMELDSNSTWSIDFQAEWPADVSVNAWGINPDGNPDVTRVFGDVDGDNILDRIPPQSLLQNVINITEGPPSPFLAYRLELNDASFRYRLIPRGSRWVQLTLYILLMLIPPLTGVGAVLIYIISFYQVKFNQYGLSEKATTL